MGIWTGIKHALNSTLGTADFKPLDKIFYEGKTTIASDSPLFLLLSSGEYQYNSSQSMSSFIDIPIIFNAKTDGSFKVSFELRYTAPKGGGGVAIYINGNLVASDTHADVDEYTLFSTSNISYSKGDVITFKIARAYNHNLGTSNFYIRNVNLCADVCDISMFKIEMN